GGRRCLFLGVEPAPLDARAGGGGTRFGQPQANDPVALPDEAAGADRRVEQSEMGDGHFPIPCHETGTDTQYVGTVGCNLESLDWSIRGRIVICASSRRCDVTGR